MNRIRRLSALRRDEHGATAVEYGLIISMIVLAMVGALAQVADTTGNMWNTVSEKSREAHERN
jgi:pilus assembly protein Flp/PilA